MTDRISVINKIKDVLPEDDKTVFIHVFREEVCFYVLERELPVYIDYENKTFLDFEGFDREKSHLDLEEVEIAARVMIIIEENIDEIKSWLK